MHLDALHIVGYTGAIGSLVFGLNQLRIILTKQEAKDVSVLDYVIRVVYSTCLGIYAAGKADIPFAIVGIGGAVLAVAVVVAAAFMKLRHRGANGQGSRDEESGDGGEADNAADRRKVEAA